MAKAEAAEQKARDARDPGAAAQAWREAGRLWERASEREPNEKRRLAYTANAANARARADGASSGELTNEEPASSTTN